MMEFRLRIYQKKRYRLLYDGQRIDSLRVRSGTSPIAVIKDDALAIFVLWLNYTKPKQSVFPKHINF